MKRIGLIAIAIVLVALPLFSQTVSIPDTAFLNALIERKIDTNGDKLISNTEAEAVTSLNVDYGGISNLTGIEAFVNLVTMDCSWNELTSLDVSNNSALTSLGCSNNQITSLDVSNNTVLEQLFCGNNLLTSLDVSNNTKLVELDCISNLLTSLDVSNNADLITLRCNSNLLTSLDVSNNTALKDLACANNDLTSLDVSNNDLEHLICGSNQLTSLDVSNNTRLISLACGSNQLTSLNISKNIGLLTRILTRIAFLDLSNMPTLYEVCVWEMPFPPTDKVDLVDTTGSPNVYFTTECIYNNDSIVYIPDTAFLRALIEEGVDTNRDSLISNAEAEAVLSLNVSKSGIKYMNGIEAFISLDTLDCSVNSLNSLDISNNTALTDLLCGNNHLSILDVSNNTGLIVIVCDDNPIISLDVSNNALLEKLDCSGTLLTSLDISNNSSLESLSIVNIETLYEVCVWTKPFPLDGFELRSEGSPIVYFTTECGTYSTPHYIYSVIKENLLRERPQTGDSIIRNQSLCRLDDVIGTHQYSTPETKDFFDFMFRKALFEIRMEKVTEGASVWQLYNHGFIIKTPSVIFGMDLCNFLPYNDIFFELADLLDVYFISHQHIDHRSTELRLRMQDLGKPVVIPLEWGFPGIGMNAGETKEFSQLTVTAHGGQHTVPVRQFEITTPEGIKFLHTGDSRGISHLQEVKDIDVLMTHASNRYKVEQYIDNIKPDVYLLGHIQEFIGHETPLTYCSVIDRNHPSETHILAWGERIHFDDASNDTIRPNMVENLEFQISQDSILLTWELPITSEDGDQASFYRVIKDNLKDVLLTDTQFSTSWDSIRTYNFKVYSYDDCGNQSRHYTEIDAIMSSEVNYYPRITNDFPDNSDTIDIFSGVYRIFKIKAWDPNNDSLRYKWELDQNPIQNATSSDFQFDVTELEPGLHRLTCIVSDQLTSVQNTWLIEYHTEIAIIDNEDSLMYSEQGEWKSQTRSSSYNHTYRYSLRSNIGDWAQYSFYPCKVGSYDVFQMLPMTTYALNDAVYYLKINDHVRDSVHLNQNNESGDWVKIVRFLVEAGAEVQIVVVNTGSATSGYALYADAIKFELLDNVSINDEAIDQFSSNHFSLQNYPNPFSNSTTIRIPDTDHIKKIEIIDLSGRIIKVINNVNSNSVIIQRDNLPSGLYLLRIYAEHIYLKKVIIR